MFSSFLVKKKEFFSFLEGGYVGVADIYTNTLFGRQTFRFYRYILLESNPQECIWNKCIRIRLTLGDRLNYLVRIWRIYDGASTVAVAKQRWIIMLILLFYEPSYAYDLHFYVYLTSCILWFPCYRYIQCRNMQVPASSESSSKYQWRLYMLLHRNTKPYPLKYILKYIAM